jgi:hypothetical protein
MLRIRLLIDDGVVETVDARWTINIAEIASRAVELEPQHGADDWDVINEIDTQILTKTRWNGMRRGSPI